MSRVVRKPAFCIYKNKDADQLPGNREADQRLCFRYIDSTIPLLANTKLQTSSHLLSLYSPVCVGPGRKPRRPVFSQRGSYRILRSAQTAQSQSSLCTLWIAETYVDVHTHLIVSWPLLGKHAILMLLSCSPTKYKSYEPRHEKTCFLHM